MMASAKAIVQSAVVSRPSEPLQRDHDLRTTGTLPGREERLPRLGDCRFSRPHRRKAVERLYGHDEDRSGEQDDVDPAEATDETDLLLQRGLGGPRLTELNELLAGRDVESNAENEDRGEKNATIAARYSGAITEKRTHHGLPATRSLVISKSVRKPTYEAFAKTPCSTMTLAEGLTRS
jgi:hypothetical protein